jgi:acetyl esterase/lipase
MPNLRIAIAVLITVVMTAPPSRLRSVSAADDVPEGVLFEKDIVEYSNPDGQHLQLNLARQKDGAGPFPAIVCIHGGGFRAGTREGFDSLCIIERLKAADVDAELMTIEGADHGFRGASPEVKAQIEEARIAFFDKYLKRR